MERHYLFVTSLFILSRFCLRLIRYFIHCLQRVSFFFLGVSFLSAKSITITSKTSWLGGW